MKYGYIYKTTFPIGSFKMKDEQPFYIGQHKRSEFDSKYFGSGRKVTMWIKKHGTLKLICEVLAWAETHEELQKLEELYVNPRLGEKLCLNLYPGGHYRYNLSENAKARMIEGARKKKGPCSEETKRKISEAQKGKPRPPESIKKMTEKMKGKKYPNRKRPSKEANKALSQILTGRTLSEEHKLRVSESNKKRWNTEVRPMWFTDGSKNVRRKECPVGFRPGFIKDGRWTSL